MTANVFWLLARAAGVGSLVALALSLLTGMALRSGILNRIASNRGISELHTYTTVLWIPLGIVHVVGLLFDPYARVRPIDLVIPFLVPYAPLAIGLGTVSLLLLALVLVTTYYRRSLSQDLWLGIHQLSYVAFVSAFAHSVQSGTDLAYPFLNLLVWATGLALAAGWLRRIASQRYKLVEAR
ncbi:MAG: ferric reductase-like transmembrane domain-containing protein [Chloroflexota bacterium]|nr:ferric reductase-like transmembrane domain-containing protein [Chloroflexota bacterium]MDE3101917.1 ferric reductase-like transmembrane domain-containing protein [Chloroflexota bacterium]